MAGESLLDKARAELPKRASVIKIDDDLIELVWAWVNQEIQTRQVSIALGVVKPGEHRSNSGSVAHARIAQVFRHLVLIGELEPGPMLRDIAGMRAKRGEEE